MSKSTHGGPASDVCTSGGLASVVGKNTHSGPASDVCQSRENVSLMGEMNNITQSESKMRPE